MDTYTVVDAVVTAPWGETSTVTVATVPTWAVEAGLTPEWKRTYRTVALDAIGTYGGPGWRVKWRFTPEEQGE